MVVIESTKNETVKRTRELATRKCREKQGLHFIEGDKLVREAVISGAIFRDAFIEEGHELMQAILEGAGATIHLVTRKVMESLSDTTEPQYVCATVETPDTTPPTDSYPKGLIVVLDCVQDPGNIGTIIRTADAFSASAVLLGEGCADAYSPKTVRASMGSVYHIPIWAGNAVAELNKLRKCGYTLICGHLDGTENFPEIKKGQDTVLVIGNEGNGVSDEIADTCIKYCLPMSGMAESLNASVAAGILIYELSKRIN